jgi:hypothetical protein
MTIMEGLVYIVGMICATLVILVYLVGLSDKWK